MQAKQVLYPCYTPAPPFLVPLSGGHLALRWAPSPEVDTLGGNNFLSNSSSPFSGPLHAESHCRAQPTKQSTLWHLTPRLAQEPCTSRNHKYVPSGSAQLSRTVTNTWKLCDLWERHLASLNPVTSPRCQLPPPEGSFQFPASRVSPCSSPARRQPVLLKISFTLEKATNWVTQQASVLQPEAEGMCRRGGVCHKRECVELTGEGDGVSPQMPSASRGDRGVKGLPSYVHEAKI